MHSSKGKMEIETLGRVLLLSAFLVMVTLMFVGCRDAFEGTGIATFGEFACWGGNVLKGDSNVLFPSACNPRVVEEPSTEEAMAAMLVKCWWMYGEGKQDLGPEDLWSKEAFTAGDIVHTCYAFRPKETITYLSLVNYMEDHKKGKESKGTKSDINFINQGCSYKECMCMDKETEGYFLKDKIYYIKFIDSRGITSEGAEDMLLISRRSDFGDDFTGFDGSLFDLSKAIFDEDPRCENLRLASQTKTDDKKAIQIFNNLTAKLETCSKQTNKVNCECEKSYMIADLPSIYKINIELINHKGKTDCATSSLGENYHTYKFTLYNVERKKPVFNEKKETVEKQLTLLKLEHDFGDGKDLLELNQAGGQAKLSGSNYYYLERKASKEGCDVALNIRSTSGKPSLQNTCDSGKTVKQYQKIEEIKGKIRTEIFDYLTTCFGNRPQFETLSSEKDGCKCSKELEIDTSFLENYILEFSVEELTERLILKLYEKDSSNRQKPVEDKLGEPVEFAIPVQTFGGGSSITDVRLSVMEFTTLLVSDYDEQTNDPPVTSDKFTIDKTGGKITFLRYYKRDARNLNHMHKIYFYLINEKTEDIDLSKDKWEECNGETKKEEVVEEVEDDDSEFCAEALDEETCTEDTVDNVYKVDCKWDEIQLKCVPK